MSEGTKGHTMNRSTVGFFSLGSRLRRRPGVVAVTLLVALIGAIVAPPSSAQGRPFQLDGLQGGSLGPSDFDQGVVIAVVWASWSPHCRDIVARVDAIAERWGSQSRVIMVDFQEDRADVEVFLAGQRPRAKGQGKY